jgi:hypothetical protein
VAPFTDVPATAPIAGAIAWLKEQRITRGYASGTFQPTSPISRASLAAFLYRDAHNGQDALAPTTPPFTDVPTTAPLAGDIAWLRGHRITRGYANGTFRPASEITREAVAAFLYRAASQ